MTQDRITEIEQEIARLRMEQYSLTNAPVAGLGIYLVSRVEEGGYDTYSDFVVAERSADAARHRDPDGKLLVDGPVEEYSTWVSPNDATAELIGLCNGAVVPGTVFCASYHAG